LDGLRNLESPGAGAVGLVLRDVHTEQQTELRAVHRHQVSPVGSSFSIPIK